MTNTWKRKYTKEQFIEAWNSSDSIAEVLRKLDLSKYGSSYDTARDTAKELGLTRDHMSGQAWLKGKTHQFKPPRSLEEILVEDIRISSNGLKKRLIKEGIFSHECSAPFCPLKAVNAHPFTGEPVLIKLALDHINGNNRDNRLENLRLLCYYCHGLTDTFCAKNKVRYEDRHNKQTRVSLVKKLNFVRCIYCNEPCRYNFYWHSRCNKCVDCGTKAGGLRCKSCNGRRPKETKIEWPSDEELLQRLAASSYVALARELGVSDKAVKKRLGALGPDQKKTYCSCGKQIYAGNKYCNECWMEIKKVVNWPSDEELLKLVDEYGPTKIAQRYNVGRSTLHARLRRIKSRQ